MVPSLTPSRLIRLCLKELRESLRDRRTIVTLVLMPLLVYPLLSLVLNRALLTNMTASQPGRLARIGIASDLDGPQISAALSIGYAMLQNRSYAPLYLEQVIPDKRAEANLLAEDSRAALPYPEILFLQDSGRQSLRDVAVDLLIASHTTVDELDLGGDNAGDGKAEDKTTEAFDDLKTDSTGTSATLPLAQPPTAGDPSLAQLNPGDLTKVFGQYSVYYRDGDPQSERALQLLERMLTAVNNQFSREMIGRDFPTPFTLAATPVAIKSNYADLLATMVPLVLVLMTMAGAVYPAIDLTAGERERGTMESLIVSPTPSSVILLAKYSAVVTVALLTALANLGAMTITLWVSGIGKLIFGEGVLSAGVIGVILLLLFLFTMFFAALLLAVTSFAKSFKEAQAYLIPLMLLALTPGVMSLMPGIKFTALLATVPLVNIVLLAREILIGSAEWNLALVAIICNTIYALAALVIASHLFGSDASMHGSKGSWRDLMLRPDKRQTYPTVDQMALTMAIMFPLYFVVSSSLPGFSSDLGTSLWLSAAASWLLILGVPLLTTWYRNIQFSTTYRLAGPTGARWRVLLPAIVLIAASAWMIAHEIILLAQTVGIGVIQFDQFERVAEFQERLKQLPLVLVLLTLAVTPAICEEVLFRGFVLSSLHKKSTTWAIVLSALLFGLMHVLTANVLAIERFLPTTFMGLILGWLAIRTASIWPGMLLHVLHNGLLLCMSHYEDQLKTWNTFGENTEHLPVTWLVAGGLSLVAGLFIIKWTNRTQPATGAVPLPTTSTATSTTTSPTTGTS